MVMKPPVWLLIYLCTVNYASTYHFIFPDLSIDKISGRPMVPCMNFIILISFLSSSVSGPLTIVHRKDTAIWMYGRARFEICSSCATKWLKRSALAWDSLVVSCSIPKGWCAAGVDDSTFMYSGILSIIFLMKSIINNINLPDNE